VLVQILPDVIAQLIDASKPGGIAYETAPFWNIPFLRQINICVPKSSVGRIPTACQGSSAIQAIGDIFIGPPAAGPPPPNQPPGYGQRVGFNNFLGEQGRITARNTLPDVPPARCAAWAGNLDFFACFIDHPEVIYYTIRYRKLGDLTWNFFQQEYRHPKVANLGLPNYNGDLVGPDPAIPPLHIDAGPAKPAPAYHNIESDPAWILTHRDRKAVISSWLYAPTPGSVQFRIEGYDAAGTKIVAADDSITLYIDNDGPDLSIDAVSMLGMPGDACALFTLPNDGTIAPLTVQFTANHAERFMNSYGLSVRKGNAILNFPIVAQAGLGLGAITGNYVHGDDLACSDFEGTFDDPAHHPDGSVTASIVPQGGADWLDAKQPFCTFAINLSCNIRVTNGYNTALNSYGPVQYLLGIQKG
jgi:hypothetical protein